MIAIRPCPPVDVAGQLAFLAHDEEAAAVFRRWADRIAAPTRTVVIRVDSDPHAAALAVRRQPPIVPTMHLCAADAIGEAAEYARDATAAPDLLFVVDTGGAATDIRAVVPGPPVPVPLIIFAVHSGDGRGGVLTAPWQELTSRSVAFRLIPTGHGDPLTADSPVSGLLTSLVRDIVNDAPIEVEV